MLILLFKNYLKISNFEKRAKTSKNLKKNSKRTQLFSKSLLRGDGGGTFRLHFWNVQKIW
jgi:hypothetical protein